MYGEENQQAFCDICSKTYASSSHLRQHKSKVHPQNALDLQCDVCGYKTHNRFNFKSHMDRHKKAARYMCEVCGKGCYTRSTLAEHMRGKHGEGFPCDICGTAMTSVSNLKQHRKIHEPRLKCVFYQCDICGRGFGPRSKCAFRIHILKHKGIVKQYPCHECDKILTSDNSFKQHMRKHSGIKPFRCEFCDKAFSEKKYVMLHRRIHTGEKPYVCDLCGLGFNQRSTLTAHLRAHNKSSSNLYHAPS